MSEYCKLQVLTPELNPPKDLFLGEDIVHISQEMNNNLMFDVTVNELSLCDIIGHLRAAQKKHTCKIFIEYGKYNGTPIYNRWLDDLHMLPYFKAWESYAMHLGRLSFVDLLIKHN